MPSPPRIWPLPVFESRIPPDQVIDAMKEVGDQMNSSLKETGLGLAWPARLSARKWRAKFPGVNKK